MSIITELTLALIRCNFELQITYTSEYEKFKVLSGYSIHDVSHVWNMGCQGICPGRTD